MFCFKCGKEIKDNIKFCPYCGQKQINKSNNIPTDNKITVNKPQVTEKKNGLIFAVIGVCAFIMVAFLVVGIYLVKLSDLKNDDNSVMENKSTMSSSEQTNPQDEVLNEPEQRTDEQPEEREQQVIEPKSETNNQPVNEVSAIRQQVEAELQAVEQQSKNIEEKLSQAYTDEETNQYSEQLFKVWDDYINVLWGYIKNNLSESEFNSLKQEQIDWIVNKEDAMDIAGSNKGSLETYFRNIEATNWTKDRVYQLINYLP